MALCITITRNPWRAGPWLLKAGWGALARLEFAIEAGIARKDRPAGLVGLVRRSRAAFAASHHPAYANFLRRRLDEEVVEEGESDGSGSESGEGAIHPKAWRRTISASNIIGEGSRSGRGVKTRKLKNAGVTDGVVVELGAGGGCGGAMEEEEEELSIEATATSVGRLEDALGRERKSRMGGVKDRPPNLAPAGLSRLYGSLQNGDALLDLGQGTIARQDSLLDP